MDSRSSIRCPYPLDIVLCNTYIVGMTARMVGAGVVEGVVATGVVEENVVRAGIWWGRMWWGQVRGVVGAGRREIHICHSPEFQQQFEIHNDRDQAD